VSQASAQATVAFFALVLAVSSYGLARRILPPWSSLGAALMVVGAPEVTFWARQVMLDVPAYAMVVSGAYFVLRYLDEPRARFLFGAVFCVLAAAWIKLTAVFIVPVLVGTLIWGRGWAVLRVRALWVAALVGLIGMLPLVWLTVQFGSANVESVAGRPTDVSRWSVEAWTFYARLLPQSLGVAGVLAAGMGVVTLAIRAGRNPRERPVAWVLATWFVVGYLFFSFIGVREARHGLMLLLPLGIAAAVACQYWLPARVAQGGALVLGLATFASSLVLRPAPEVNGYRDVADFVAATAPTGSVVLFHGVRDGNFVFNMRAHLDRPDLTIVRSDKQLLRVVVGERSRGVQEKGLSEVEIEQLLREVGVGLVVMQPGFWADIEQMARFERVIRTPLFTPMTSFAITGNAPHQDRLIEVLKPAYPIDGSRHSLTIDMPMVKDVFRGVVGPP
jgi:4-amino-4-deoxy-L-arabinose transferase-like glycosyltransferase